MALCVFFAGCLDSNDDAGNGPGGPGQGFAPQTGHAEDAKGDLMLVGDLSECDAGFCVAAVATNNGTESAFVSDLCQPAVSDRMESESGPVLHREPVFFCQAFSLREWAPGEEIPFELEWDGRLWNDEASAYEDAPQGVYQWHIEFKSYQVMAGGDSTELVIAFTVVIGAT